MTAEERIESVQTALQRRFRIAGRGSVTRVQELLSLGAGYFKNQRRHGRRRVDLKVLFRALEVLDVDPAEFFASVLGTADPLDGFRSEAARIRRRRRPPAILALEAKRTAGEERQGVDLAALDTLRSKNPRRVIRRTKALVSQVPDRQLPTLLGIHASACRVAGRNDEAQMVLARALDLAEERDEPAVLADLLQRASYVAFSRGEPEKALALSDRAALTYVGMGDLVGVGKTQVDQGIWLQSLDRSQEELQAFHSALAYLPADSDRTDVHYNRFGCLMNLGLTYRRLGNLDQARHFAGLARELSREVGPAHVGHLVWLQGSIARESRQHGEAEGFFRQAVEILRPVAPIDAALASLELVRLQLELGRAAEAYQTAKSMTVLLQPLRRNRIAAAAITDLVRCALTGRGLSTAFLNQIARTLKKGRAQQKAVPARAKR